MILHRSMKITINVVRLHCNLSTIRYHANGADHKRHSSLASSRACEWGLARSMKMQKMAVAKADRVSYNGIHSHSLGDKLSNFFSRFAHSCMMHFDNTKISHIACNTVLPFSWG